MVCWSEKSKIFSETLYLCDNNLTSIPPELGNLSNLKELWEI